MRSGSQAHSNACCLVFLYKIASIPLESIFRSQYPTWTSLLLRDREALFRYVAVILISDHAVTISKLKSMYRIQQPASGICIFKELLIFRFEMAATARNSGF